MKLINQPVPDRLPPKQPFTNGATIEHESIEASENAPKKIGYRPGWYRGRGKNIEKMYRFENRRGRMVKVFYDQFYAFSQGARVVRLILADDSTEPKYAAGSDLEFEPLLDRSPHFQPGEDFLFDLADGSRIFARLRRFAAGVYTVYRLNQDKYPGIIRIKATDVLHISMLVGQLVPVQEGDPVVVQSV
jgi:hypothetical protein